MTYEVNKQKFASLLGISLVAFHVFLTFYLWLSFNPEFNASGRIAVAEISTPLTAAFALGVAKWFIDTQGRITNQATVGIMYVIAVCLICFPLIGGMIYGLFAYGASNMEPEDLNRYFLYLDAALGGVFGLFFNDMFPSRDQ